MKDYQTKNSALKTVMAFHYQVLIGINRCFDMLNGQLVWFEKDGDVSLTGNSASKSNIQMEVKNYSDSLTDHHENFWKTLKNWLATEFNHQDYVALVLHTTQPFGAKSSLKGWNQKEPDQRLQIIQSIFQTRTKQELMTLQPKPIVKLQKAVMDTESIKLKEVLAKVVLFTEADDLESIKEKIMRHYLPGIPQANKQSYLEGLVGFVYGNANPLQWKVSKPEFDAKCEELTSIYCKKEFTFPPITAREATDEELESHAEKLFVKKIQGIEYEQVIPEALGNWIELHNSLDKDLDNAPQFRSKTIDYQSRLIKQFKRKHAKAKRNSTNTIRDSQNLYDDVIGESAPNMEGHSAPLLEYKNGLIHDAMDNESENLQWSVA